MAAKKRHHHSMSGAYEGHGQRRHQEMHDAGMIREDHNAVANMPQEVMMKPWNKPSYGMMDEKIDDTISGINRQMGHDESQGKRGMLPRKY